MKNKEVKKQNIPLEVPSVLMYDKNHASVNIGRDLLGTFFRNVRSIVSHIICHANSFLKPKY